MFANILLHIVFYAIIILALTGVFATLEKRKLQAQLWLSMNSRDALYEMINGYAQELDLSAFTPEYESMKKFHLTNWLERKKKAERTIKGLRLDILPEIGFFGAILALTLVAIVGSALLILFLDSLNLDFTRLFLALETLRSRG